MIYPASRMESMASHLGRSRVRVRVGGSVRIRGEKEYMYIYDASERGEGSTAKPPISAEQSVVP